MIYEVCAEWKLYKEDKDNDSTPGLAFGITVVTASSEQAAIAKAVSAEVAAGNINETEIDRLVIYCRPFK